VGLFSFAGCGGAQERNATAGHDRQRQETRPHAVADEALLAAG